jgi:hypothetical protein
LNFRLTPHAQKEAERRAIPRHLLEAVLNSPQQVVQAAQGRKTYQSQLDYGGGRIYLVRVIVDESTTPPSVITAYRTSKITKYWRGEP